MQDTTKCLMGSPGQSGYDVSEVSADPASFPAGLAVRWKSDETVSLTKADGQWLGVSMGRSLSNTKKLSVCRAGLRVPVLLSAGPARGIVTITSYANLVAVANDTLKVGATTFTFKASASTEAEVGAVTSNNQTAANLVSKINAHSVAGPLFKAVAVGAVVTITTLDNTTAGSAIDLVYTDNGTATIGATVDAATFTGGGTTAADYVAIGAKVYFSNTTGKADDSVSDSTISNAIYVSGVLSGYDEDGNAVPAALVDMQGGL